MNTFVNGLNNIKNTKLTENGAVAFKSSKSKLLDLFAFGAAYRQRSDDDCILLFKEAFDENPEYALKCLFYIRDILSGQGERRFFRVCLNWLANAHREYVKRNVKFIPEMGRWDDLYCLFGTPCELAAKQLIKEQLALDVASKTPSLLAKWLKSENTSSAESRKLATQTRKFLGMTSKQYRKTLSILRQRINVLERLMSANEWDKIEYDKIPSQAGMKYRNAFARHDIERIKAQKQTYEQFVKDEATTVNAKAMYPYECAAAIMKEFHNGLGSFHATRIDPIQRAAINKYWENMPNVMADANFNGLVVCDTSGSMTWGEGAAKPINVAVSLAMYCAERAKGPYHNTYISFSRTPQLIDVSGLDFCDKFCRIARTNLCENTDLRKVFSMLLQIAVSNHCSQDELPEKILVISDMEIDEGSRRYYGESGFNATSEIESIRREWARYGYKLPELIWWNVNARNNTILDNDPSATYVSGFSPSIFKQLMTGKTGYDLMMEVLNKPKYKDIK